ncbi:hypothetical protein CLF_101709 [Clonorchis sinensis]|uniref:Uncharacterized protein n=1 Tax=Clonorchis sinensis TaxID=79923 RepID=G7Y6D6_CLOSI|nr:hypothetical protein CLF_101709 [Clonorchis sinensis]
MPNETKHLYTLATDITDPIYGLPNGCVNLQEKTMKGDKAVYFLFRPVNDYDTLAEARFLVPIKTNKDLGYFSEAPLVTLLANVTSNAKLFQADYHLSFHKSEMINVFFSFYEQQETQEFRHLWKFLSTLIRIGLKYETRFLFVPKITALTLRLSSPKVDNQILLKLGEQDQQAYNTILDKVYADLTTIMRQSGLVTAVWSFSLDALEADVESHTAWIYIKLDLNKMPSDFSQTSLQSRPLEAYISGKVNAVTGLSPTSAHVHRAVLTQSRIGCTYMGRKLTPEQICDIPTCNVIHYWSQPLTMSFRRCLITELIDLFGQVAVGLFAELGEGIAITYSPFTEVPPVRFCVG